jgi:hypothetical protein
MPQPVPPIATIRPPGIHSRHADDYPLAILATVAGVHVVRVTDHATPDQLAAWAAQIADLANQLADTATTKRAAIERAAERDTARAEKRARQRGAA